MEETIEKVRCLQRKLESYSGKEFSKIIAVLQKLDQLPVSVEVLQGTGIGKVVNTFRKHEGGVSEHARNLIKKWKALVQAAMDAEAEQEAEGMKESEVVNENYIVKEEHLTRPDVHISKPPLEHPKPKDLNCKISDKKPKLGNSKTATKPSQTISTNSLLKDESMKASSSKVREKTSKEKSHSPVVSKRSKYDGDVKNAKTLKLKSKPSPEHEEHEELEFQNTGLSFADCLAGASPVVKVDKLKSKGHVDRQKSSSLIKKSEDSSIRNEKNSTPKADLAFSSSCGRTNPTSKTKSNDVKMLHETSSHSSDDNEIHRKHKSSKHIDGEEEIKYKTEQKLKKGSTGGTMHKLISSTERKTDSTKKGSKEKSQNVSSLHKHQNNMIKGETADVLEKSRGDDHKKSSTNTSKAKILNSGERSDKSKTKTSSSQQHAKTSKTSVEVKKNDRNKKSIEKSEKQRKEKPKEKLEMKDRMEKKKEKKKEYSSGEESEDDICFESTGLSFGDCLFGEPPAMTKPTGGSKKRTLPVQEKHKSHVIKENSPSRSGVKQGGKSLQTKEDLKVSKKLASKTKSQEICNDKKRKIEEVHMETPSSHKRIKDCYDAGILLPEITTDYKPLRRPADDSSPRKRSQASSVEDHQIQFKGAKESRTKVFSGRARVYLTAVPTLFDACMRILCDNIDLLEDVGGVPFDILKPVLERCTFQQLYRLEEYNPHFIEDSDNLWQKHVEKEFKLSKPIRAETWRQCYLRSFDEREQKFKLLTENITASYAKKDTGRKVMLAYVDRPAKAPRNVRRKQEQHGTAGPVTPHEAFANPHKKSSWAVPRNEDTLNPSNRQARSVKIIAPMMQKTLRYIKKMQKR